MEKRWNKAENAYLKSHAERDLAELADHFRTDEDSVRQQLAELQLTTIKSQKIKLDAALGDYDKALALLHDKKWQKAADLFEKVVGAADSRHLADRARQNLEVCRQRIDDDQAPADPYLQAVFEKNAGQLEDALKLCLEQGKVDKEERYAYLAASIQALAGAEEEAIDHLEVAIRLEPKNRVHAYHDPDFKELQGNDAFSAMIASDSAS